MQNKILCCNCVTSLCIIFFSFFSQQHQEWSDRMWSWQNAFFKVKSACWITWLWFTQVSLLYLGTTLQCKLSHLLDHQAGHSEPVFSALTSHYNANYLSHLLNHQAGHSESAFSALASHTTMQTTCLTCWVIRLVTESVFSALASHTTMQTTCLTCWIIRLVTESVFSALASHTTKQTTCLTCWIIRLVTESVFSALASHTTMQTVSPVGSSGWSLCILCLGITHYNANCLTCWIIRLVTLSLYSLPWHHATMQTTCFTCRIIRLGFYGITVHLGLLFLPWHHTTMQTVSPVGASGWSLWVCQLYLGTTLQCKLPVSLVGLPGWGFTAYLGLLSLPWHHTTLQTTSLTCWIIRLGFIWVCLLRF